MELPSAFYGLFTRLYHTYHLPCRTLPNSRRTNGANTKPLRFGASPFVSFCVYSTLTNLSALTLLSQGSDATVVRPTAYTLLWSTPSSISQPRPPSLVPPQEQLPQSLLSSTLSPPGPHLYTGAACRVVDAELWHCCLAMQPPRAPTSSTTLQPLASPTTHSLASIIPSTPAARCCLAMQPPRAPTSSTLRLCSLWFHRRLSRWPRRLLLGDAAASGFTYDSVGGVEYPQYPAARCCLAMQPQRAPTSPTLQHPSGFTDDSLAGLRDGFSSHFYCFIVASIPPLYIAYY